MESGGTSTNLVKAQIARGARTKANEGLWRLVAGDVISDRFLLAKKNRNVQDVGQFAEWFYKGILKRQ